jgi:hypothetical protein
MAPKCRKLVIPIVHCTNLSPKIDIDHLAVTVDLIFIATGLNCMQTVGVSDSCTVYSKPYTAVIQLSWTPQTAANKSYQLSIATKSTK